MPRIPDNAQISAATDFMKKKIDPKKTVEKLIEETPEVRDFLLERGLIEIKEN
jgi:hypothetical protein